MTDNIYWILKADIADGQLDAVKALSSTFCDMTANEPGAIAYEWSVSSDGKALHAYERFENSDAALAHLGNVGPRLPELFALVTPTVIECYGSASDTFKEAVKDLPIVYYEQFAGFRK